MRAKVRDKTGQQEAHRQSAGRIEHGAIYPTSVSPVVMLESNVPLVVEVDDFSYTYRCKHCGHQWSEERFKTQNEKIDQNVMD